MDGRDRIRGSLIGLAVGDALGAPVEVERPGTFPPVTGFRAGGQSLGVARVGTHALTASSKVTLWQRLAMHKGTQDGGSHHRSVFRLHVGGALLARGGFQPSLGETWGRGSSSGSDEVRAIERPLEKAISNYIGTMPFLVLAAGDEPRRASEGTSKRTPSASSPLSGSRRTRRLPAGLGTTARIKRSIPPGYGTSTTSGRCTTRHSSRTSRRCWTQTRAGKTDITFVFSHIPELIERPRIELDSSRTSAAIAELCDAESGPAPAAIPAPVGVRTTGQQRLPL